MIDRLFFYSHFGAGDLFESREFVRDIMDFVPANQYIYAHTKNPRMFIDMPNLGYSKITQKMNVTLPYVKEGKDLYINTWIGRNSKYVLSKIGCVIDKSYEMFSDILKDLSLPAFRFPFIEYIPMVDYSYLHTENIDRFIEEHRNKYKTIVLICNGKVFSMQAENFDFTPVISDLAFRRKDCLFLTTEHTGIEMTNLFNVPNIIKAVDLFDLNEISYLATLVDVIVGRKSGPFCFAHNRDVWYSNKKSLSFTYAEHSSHFIQGNKMPLRKYWSPAIDQKEVIRKIEEVINE